jgi:tetratricopeptide (TPR) repeat protein
VVRAASVRVPDQLQGLLAARVDRLEPGPRRTLHLAAVIGKSFGYRVLRSIAADPEDLGDHIDKLERAGLIVETAEEPDLEFGFKHPLLQEAAYASMLVRERRAYHQRVGEALERDLGGRQDHAATLAHHFDEAGDAERALRYRTAAAQRAAQLFAHTEAIVQYRRALELASDPADRSRLYRGLGQALQLSGDHAGALTTYETMATDAVSRGDKAMELSAVTSAATVRAIPSERQDPQAALALLDRALVLAAELGDRAAEGRAHWNRMLLMQFSGLDVAEAVSHGERALSIARELHLEELQAYALHDMADALFFLRRPDEAWPAFGESRALFSKLDNPTMVADSIGREAHLLMMAGRYTEASSRIEEALELNRRTSNPWGVAYSTFVRMHLRWEMDERDGAISDGRALVEMAASASALIRRASSDLAVMLGQQGDVPGGLSLTDEADGRSGTDPLRHWLLGARARVLVMAGRLEEAESAWRASFEEFPREGALIHMHMALHVWLAGVEIALARRDPAEARTWLHEIVRYTSERAIAWHSAEIAALQSRADSM